MGFKQNGVHFLIVEDNQGDLVLVKNYIEEEFKDPVIYEAVSYNEAKKILGSGIKVDVILLDLMLPDKAGEDLIKKIVPLAGNVPIIILTGNSDREFSIKSLSYGVSDYLLKDDLNAYLLFKSVVYNIEQKKIRLQLAESEQKYRDIFNFSPVPKVVYDMESLYFLDANTAALKKYETTIDNFLQLKISDIIHDEDLEIALKIIKQKQSNSTFGESALRHVTKSGTIINVETQSTDFIFQNRKARMVLINDITEKLESKKTTQLSEQRFRALIQDGSEMISILDTNGRFIYISPNINAKYNINADSFLGQNAFDFLHPEDAEHFRSEFLQIKEKKRISTRPFRYMRFENNEWRWLEANVVDMTDNEAVKGIVLNARDVTTRVENELQLLETNRRYEAIAKATSDAIYEYDALTKKIHIAGSNYNKIFGFNFIDPILDLDFWISRLHPSEVESVRKAIASLKPGDTKHHDLEYRFRKQDDSYAFVSDRFDIVWENNKPIKKIGALQDITTRKFQEKALAVEKDIYKLNSQPDKSLKSILEHALENVEEMISGASASILEIKHNTIRHFAGISMPQNYIEAIYDLPLKNTIFTKENHYIQNISIEPLCKSFAEKAKLNGYISCWSIPIKKTDGTLIGSLVTYFKFEKKNDSNEIYLLERIANLIGVLVENKTSAEELKQAKDRYDIVAKATSDTIWDWKIQEDKFIWNKGIYGVFGYKKNQVGENSKWWFDRIHPEDSLRMSVKLYNFLEKKVEKWQDEYRFQCADGSYKYVFDRGFLIKDDEGKPFRMIGSMQDVTRQKEEEQRLRLMETAITQSKDAVVITNTDISQNPIPNILFVNEAFEKMSGYKSSELIGKSPMMFKGVNSDVSEFKKLSKAIKNEHATQIETISYRKNGEEYWVNFSMIPIWDKEGRLSHWISIQRDVTEQKKQEKEKEQLIRELTQNNKDLKQFSYITSHNLRAPLSNLTGLLNLIEDIPMENEDLKLILKGFSKSTHLLNETINDLVKVVIIKDNPSVQKERVLFSEVFENVFNQLNYLFNLHQPILKIKLEEDSIANINKAYLESIILNLVTNAIKYRDVSRKLKITITTIEHPDYTEFIFEDNGIGIDVALNKDKIFGLYQRFHNYPDSKGLGLYLVKSQVETMGGSIEVESQVGKGTKFKIKFKKE
ncbi:PAS domain S-box protein [Flavobacterium sp. NST-5]|uniref:histidine kinase n=1 Tax=Flavobacterium ichthyis TaxID=2698827 RepID=A0ABW9Z5P0_9FLAO|nr:PAS domain S-box protein [Flavobacterium ichthyis]NBL64148.1 PAS domain S-box protein [Flavobacterium ichthyis]